MGPGLVTYAAILGTAVVLVAVYEVLKTYVESHSHGSRGGGGTPPRWTGGGGTPPRWTGGGGTPPRRRRDGGTPPRRRRGHGRTGHVEENRKVDVTLDPGTAHPCLHLSADWKSVSWGRTRQDLQDHPKRFDIEPCVLGINSFSSGRYYWEVDVGGSINWKLGVCEDSVMKKGEITLSPEEGYWAVGLSGEGEYVAFTSPETPLHLSERPQAVGILVDCEAGKVSFYNADDESHLFTFTNTFREPLHPFFCTYGAPLKIRPVTV